MIDYQYIAREIVTNHTTYANGKRSYEPCYFDRGSTDTDEEVMSAFMSGESDEHGFPRWRELAYDRLMEWESDCIWDDAVELARQYEQDEQENLPDTFDRHELAGAIRDELWDANTQDVALEWVQRMDSPRVRVMLTDEDHELACPDEDVMTPEVLCGMAGIEPTDSNMQACRTIIANAYYPGSYRSLFIVFTMDIPSDMSGYTVRIVGQVELWAANPYLGDGMSDTVDVDMTIPRSMLRTDKDAPGYSYDEVFGPNWGSMPTPDVTFLTNTEAAA